MDTHLHVYIRTVRPLTTTGGGSAQIKDHVYFYMHGVPSELLADLFIRLLYRSAIVLANTMSRYIVFWWKLYCYLCSMSFYCVLVHAIGAHYTPK